MKKLFLYLLFFLSNILLEAGQQNPQDMLYAAIEAGSIADIDAAVAAGADVNYAGDGSTPLRNSIHDDAVQGDNFAIARHLLNLGAGASINVKFLDEAPLHIAATFGNPRMVQLLIENGADVYSKSEDESDDGEACGKANDIARFFAGITNNPEKRANFIRCAELIETRQAQILRIYHQIGQRIERARRIALMRRRRVAQEIAMYAFKRFQRR